MHSTTLLAWIPENWATIRATDWRLPWVIVASFLAGTLNAVAGGGSFLSFPAMLSIGLGPIQANATNTVALWPGQLTSIAGYRDEVRKHFSLAWKMALAGLVGIGITAYAAVKSGPLASLFRALNTISNDPAKLNKLEAATPDQKASLIAVTDKLPEVATVTTTNTAAGKALANSVVSPTVTAAVKTAVMVVAALVLWSGFAMAQTKRDPVTTIKSDLATNTDGKPCLIPWDPLKLCGTLTGKPEDDMQRVVKRIQAVGRDDMNYAILKATAATTSSSKVRLQCLQAILKAKDDAEGVTIKDAAGNVVPRPDPAFVTQIEDVAELVDGLSPTGALWTSCAGAAQLFKTNVLAVINGIVTGAAGIAALPAGF